MLSKNLWQNSFCQVVKRINTVMSTSIKQRLKSVMVKFPRMYKTLYWGISIVTDFDGREHKKRGGTNSPKDTIYMIRPCSFRLGIKTY